VESSVTTSERTEADPLMAGAGMAGRTLTERVLRIADQAGYRAALIDATDGSVTAWPRFAGTVRAAGAGLTRRGLAAGDTAGVFVRDAAEAAIAINAIRAAGAAACLIRSGARPADVAARLNDCGARLLITSAPLAELAAEGADRSRVRQVISFGEAAGTTPFGSLLGSGPADGPAALVEPGRPEEGNGQADQYELTHRDVVVAGPPCGDGQAYTSFLDLTLLTGATLVAAPLPLVAAAMRVYKGTAVIVPRGTGMPDGAAARVFPVG
jgi:hypothetical protein